MIRLSLIIVILFVTQCWGQSINPLVLPAPESAALTLHEKWSLVFDGMTALGTLLVALLAVFGQRIRSWIIRPRLSVAVGDKPPYAEKKEEPEESTSGAKVSYQLRLEISNDGREAARNCVVLCNKVLREKAGGKEFYTLREFVPLQFYWTTKSQTTDVVPKLLSYLNIAEVSISEESVSGNASNITRSPDFTLQVQVEAEGIKGRFFRVDKGKIILPIIVHADNLPRSIKKYVEICWRGNSEADFTPEKFQIRVLNEAEGMRLVGGA